MIKLKYGFKFRVLSVALVFCLTILLAISCGSVDEGATTRPGTLVSNPDSSQTEGGEKGEDVFEGFVSTPDSFDLEGAVVVVSGWGGEAAKIQLGETGDIERIEKRRKMAEEKYNFTFDFVFYSGQAYADMFAASSATGVFFADIVRSPTYYSFPTWLDNGFYAPLDEIIDFGSEKYSSQSGLSKWIDGKHYYLTMPVLEPYALVYNPDMLERAGAPDPLVLAQEGNWDWDALLEIAILTTQNVGTANEQYGLRGWFQRPLMMSNGVAESRVRDGALVSDLFEQSCLNALNFWRKLYVEEQVVDPADWSIGSQNFINGTNAMMIGERWQLAQLREQMSDFKVVPMPFGPDNENREIISNNIGVTGFSPISEFLLDQLVALWVYSSATDLRSDANTYIDPFENFSQANWEAEYPFFDCMESLELFWDTMVNSTYSLGPNVDGQLMWDYVVGGDSPIALGESPSTVLATMENEVKAYLEALLN